MEQNHCHVLENITDQKRLDTEEKTKNDIVFKSKGNNVVEMWECEFDAFCLDHPKIHYLGWELSPILNRKGSTEEGWLKNKF